MRTDSASCLAVEPNVVKSCCTEGESGGAEGAAVVGVGGVERRGFSVFLSERTFGAALTAVCRGVDEGGVVVVVLILGGWWACGGRGGSGSGACDIGGS